MTTLPPLDILTLAGLGFIHAFDRLTQIDFSRAISLGLLDARYKSSVPPGDARQIDLSVHEAGIPEAAKEAGLKIREGGEGALLEAYVEGINAFITMEGPRPIEMVLMGQTATEWRLEDTLGIVGLMT